jgi:hypothetical protein
VGAVLHGNMTTNLTVILSLFWHRGPMILADSLKRNLSASFACQHGVGARAESEARSP